MCIHINYIPYIIICLSDETLSDIKLKKSYVVDRDEVCERGQNYRYVRSTNFCTNHNEVPCTGDGPVMAIDANTDEPYWYVVGVFSYGPHKCGRLENQPKFSVKVVSFLDWIHFTINRKD